MIWNKDSILHLDFSSTHWRSITLRASHQNLCPRSTKNKWWSKAKSKPRTKNKRDSSPKSLCPDTSPKGKLSKKLRFKFITDCYVTTYLISILFFQKLSINNNLSLKMMIHYLAHNTLMSSPWLNLIQKSNNRKTFWCGIWEVI